ADLVTGVQTCALPISLVAEPDVLLKLPPVIFNVALAVWFGRTLARGEEPMISWFARLVRGTELPPDIARYTRWSTVIWTAFFVRSEERRVGKDGRCRL